VTSSHVSGRIVRLTTYVTAVLIVTSYTASLVSHVMTAKYKLTFNNFEEFLSDGTYQLGVLLQSVYQHIDWIQVVRIVDW